MNQDETNFEELKEEPSEEIDEGSKNDYPFDDHPFSRNKADEIYLRGYSKMLWEK